MATASGQKTAGGAMNNAQSQAVLIAALVCSCISLLLVLITLRWFLIMRRGFRHRLVLHLIISDTLKAIWYFVFPVVVFARGPVASTSNFCQASGFLLAFAIEASDMAILIIALHSILYICRPNNAIGEGGLYRYRHWIYPFWLIPPLLAASLAFIDDSDGYVTAGTFCYLPKRPFWYRLALSWVPRYLIIGVILTMYIWIYIYVHVKFRGFENLGETDSSYDSELRRRSALSTASNDTELRSRSLPVPIGATPWNPQYQEPRYGVKPSTEQLQPWDHMNFITTRPLQDPTEEPGAGIEPMDMEARPSAWSGETQTPALDTLENSAQAKSKRQGSSNEQSKDSTQRHQSTGTRDTAGTISPKAFTGPADPLQKTRIAIRKQLRYLFIYPLVYIIMWSFPFASHALTYNEYYVAHPIFWLSVVQTIMLSLQAGADSVLFSISEKPWRRVDSSSKFSVRGLRRRSIAFLQRRSNEKSPASTSETGTQQPQPTSNVSSMWWEAEGRRRKDSVWLGTNTASDNVSSIATRPRSKSPQKPGRSLHSRTRSHDQGPAFVPRLESIPPELPPFPIRE